MRWSRVAEGREAEPRMQAYHRACEGKIEELLTAGLMLKTPT